MGSGDVKGDTFVDGNDIDAFVAEMLNPTAPSPTSCRANMDGLGSVDVANVQLFVAALLGAETPEATDATKHRPQTLR